MGEPGLTQHLLFECVDFYMIKKQGMDAAEVRRGQLGQHNSSTECTMALEAVTTLWGMSVMAMAAGLQASQRGTGVPASCRIVRTAVGCVLPRGKCSPGHVVEELCFPCA